MASAAVQHEGEGRLQAALNSYIQAVELHLRLGDSGDAESKRLAARLLSRAERLQARIASQQGGDTSTEQGNRHSRSVLAASSNIHGCIFRLWHDDAPPTEDAVRAPEMWRSLSGEQATWEKPRIIDQSCVYDRRVVLRGSSLQQGSATDCSFVAALEVCAEYDARFGSNVSAVTFTSSLQLAHAPLYPRSSGFPCASAEGHYSVKLHLNGAPRRVTIDDSLPRDAHGELVGVSVCEGKQLWPALIEKAYLAAVGSGYAYHGSDAAADLFMLTAWIPEMYTLQGASFQREKTWSRLCDAWQAGNCLLTVGTSAVQSCARTQGLEALVPSHCYGVLSLSDDSARLVTLVNPWKLPPHESPHPQEARPHSSIITCTWDDLCEEFATLCVNWKPSLFAYACHAHGEWQVSRQRPQPHDQHLVVVDGPSEVLVHLERHIGSEGAGERSPRASDYIAVHAYVSGDAQKRMNVDVGGDRVRYQIRCC